MRSGEIIYTNSIEARNRPGPKPELRATFKVNDKNESFVFLAVGVTSKPLTEEDLEKVMNSWGWFKKKPRKAKTPT